MGESKKRKRSEPEGIISDQSASSFIRLKCIDFPYYDEAANVGFASKTTLTTFQDLYYKRQFRSTRWPHVETMKALGIYENLNLLCERLGIIDIFNAKHKTYNILTCEFLASLKLENDKENNEWWVSFQVMGNTHRMTYAAFGSHLGLPSTGRVGLKRDRTDDAVEDRKEFWMKISRSEKPFKTGSSNSSEIRNPVLKYFHRILSESLFSTSDSQHKVGVVTLICMLDALSSHRTIDLPTSVLEYFANQAAKETTVISCGGLISLLVDKMGFEGEYPTSESDVLSIDKDHLYQWFVNIREDLTTFRISETRAISLPDKQHTDIIDERNWGMPRRDGV